VRIRESITSPYVDKESYSYSLAAIAVPWKMDRIVDLDYETASKTM